MDIEKLELKIDTSGLENLTAALDRLSEAMGRVTDAVEAVNEVSGQKLNLEIIGDLNAEAIVDEVIKATQ